MNTHPALAALLDVLATLDEAVLANVYLIERDCGAPLDVALFAWRDAGRPGAPVVENAPPDARAILGSSHFFAWRDVGAIERQKGNARPDRQGPEGDAMREGWDAEDARMALAEDRGGNSSTASNGSDDDEFVERFLDSWEARISENDEDDGAPDAAGETGGLP